MCAPPALGALAPGLRFHPPLSRERGGGWGTSLPGRAAAIARLYLLWWRRAAPALRFAVWQMFALRERR